MVEPRQSLDRNTEDFLVGGGEMGALMRALDFSTTPLGAVSCWPQSLRSAVSICLNSRFPIVLYWGPQFVSLYNDAYIPVWGQKHPWALGKPFEVAWADIWDVLGPVLKHVMATGEPSWSDDQLLIMQRHGYSEETYFTFSFGAGRDEKGEVGGIFCAVTETTQRVLQKRRLDVLKALTPDAKTSRDAAELAVRTLEGKPDVTFALIYLIDKVRQEAYLAGGTGVPDGSIAAPAAVVIADGDAGTWPFARIAATGSTELIHDLDGRFGTLPAGRWPEPTRSAAVLPLKQAGQDEAAGFLVLGISPRRALDDAYREFFELVAGHVATMISNGQAYEEERKRAESLAELDRAKTVFFSNVSHEFRTPLTLMLGPLEELLRRVPGPSQERKEIELVQRNSLRLLKLVNTLLEFSRLEASRIRATYQPTDLASLTAELAGVFRSAIERAGLRFVVECPPLREPVYVDRDMWEKIVLNLLSNALKFTFEGEIAVSLSEEADHVVLSVRDSGTGIPPEELPHVFDRFHRIEGARGRTHEGTGIGLALVQELTRLHGGIVEVHSIVGEGSAFHVRIPLGKAHLPADRIDTSIQASPAASPTATAYLQETLQWLPSELSLVARPSSFVGESQSAGDLPQTTASRFAIDASPEKRPRVLFVDDNADMRDYVSRLLGERYDVTAAADGEAALAEARDHSPDVIVSDVMMPRLDGFGLLRAVRSDPALEGVPVILLSARAGEEAQLDGLDAGADDYLIKPFTARELVARVETHLRQARLRAASDHRLRRQNERLELLADALAHLLADPHPGRIIGNLFPKIAESLGVDAYLHFKADAKEHALKLCSFSGVDEVTARALTRLAFGQAVCGTVAQTRQAIVAHDVQHSDDDKVTLIKSLGIQAYVCHPLLAGDRLLGTLAFASRSRASYEPEEVEFFKLLAHYATLALQRSQAESDLSESGERYRGLVNVIPAAMYTIDREGRITFYNDRAADLWGRAPELGDEDTRFCGAFRLYLPDGSLLPHDRTPMADAVRTGNNYRAHEILIERPNGSRCCVLVNVDPVRDLDGAIIGAVNVFTDITERRRVEEKRRQFFNLSNAMLVEAGFDGRLHRVNAAWEKVLGWTVQELTSRPWLDFVHPDDRSATVAAGERLREGFEVANFDNRYRHKDGSYRWIRWNTSPSRDHEIICGVAEDVTERKLAEEALRSSEERLRLAMAAGNMGAWDVELATGAVAWDAKQHELFGRSIHGRPMDMDAFYDLVHPDDVMFVKQAAAQAQLTGRFSGEFRIVLPDGRVRWIAGQGAVVKDETGRSVRMIGVNYDVTDRKEAQARLERFAEELERQIAERTQELVRSQDRLRALAAELNLAEQRERKRLATELHDYLAQILVLGRLKLGQTKQIPDLPSKCNDLIRQTEGVLSEALTYTRTLVADLSPPVLRDFGLPAALRWLGEQMHRHELTVQVSVEGDDQLKLPEDQTVLLFQSIRELLMNAAKHAGTREASVRLMRHVGMLCVEVRDNGHGFDPAALGITASLSSKFGLFSIRERMRALGGQFEIQSAPGQGTTATLVLPLGEETGGKRVEGIERDSTLAAARDGDVARSSFAPTPVPPTPRCQPRIRVLLVDDHAMVRQGLRSVLETYVDVEIVGEALDGEEAMACVDQLEPDVVVMDINMPKLNGIDATARIKTCHSKVVVIGLSVNAGGENHEAMTKAGAALLLTKEAAVEELYQAIREVLADRE